MTTRTLSSCKRGTRVGYTVILRKGKHAQETASCLMRLLPPVQKPGRAFTDNSKECTKADQNVQSTQDTISPHRSEISGVAERIVARIKGTAKVMVHSIPKNGTARYVRDKMAGDKTACEKKTIPFGAKASYDPSFGKMSHGCIKLAKRCFPDCEEPKNVSASEIQMKRFQHQKKSDKKKSVVSMCKRDSQTLRSSSNPSRPNARPKKL